MDLAAADGKDGVGGERKLMQKLHPSGEYREWDNKATPDWTVTEAPSTTPNLQCQCGGRNWEICWWDYPFTGGYLRIVCSECGFSAVILDDYA